MKFQVIKHYNVNKLLISDIMTVRQSVVPYSSQTDVSLLGHEPGDVFSNINNSH